MANVTSYEEIKAFLLKAVRGSPLARLMCANPRAVTRQR